jgi:hypothetical protein
MVHAHPVLNNSNNLSSSTAVSSIIVGGQMLLNSSSSYGNATQCNFTHSVGFSAISINSNKCISGIPKGEFYYLGERVLRPAIDGIKHWLDVAHQIASYVMDLFKTLFYSIDNVLSRLCNFIPGVRATKGIYNNQGPFRPFNPVAIQSLLPRQTLYWFDVTRFEQSKIYSGILRIVRKIGNLFVNEAYPIKHGLNGVELGDPRILSQNSNEAQSFSMGVELTENSSAELFTNATRRAIYINSLSENRVTKTCRFDSDSTGRPKNIWSVNNNTIITELTDASNLAAYHTNIDTCVTIKLNSRADAIYRSPKEDKVDLFTLSTVSGQQSIFIKGVQSSTGNPVGPVQEIRPLFNATMRNIRVIENPETDKNVVLIASTNPPGFCSQLLDKINNYKPIISSSPYCQEVRGASLINGLTFEKISQKDLWRGYVSLFDLISNNADKTRNGSLITTSEDFRLASEDPTHFSFNINTGSGTPSARGSSFILSNPKISRQITSIWINTDLQAATMDVNPIHVKGKQTSEGVTLQGEIGVYNSFTIFDHTSKAEDIRYNFTYLGTDQKPIKDGIDCAELDDPDISCHFDWKRGVIRVLSQFEDTLFFNASASYKDLFRASAKIKVEVINSRKGSPMTIIYIGLVAVTLCFVAVGSFICCVVAGIWHRVWCRKGVSLSTNSKNFDNLLSGNEQELNPLLSKKTISDEEIKSEIDWEEYERDFEVFKVEENNDSKKIEIIGKSNISLNIESEKLYKKGKNKLLPLTYALLGSHFKIDSQTESELLEFLSADEEFFHLYKTYLSNVKQARQDTLDQLKQGIFSRNKLTPAQTNVHGAPTSSLASHLSMNLSVNRESPTMVRLLKIFSTLRDLTVLVNTQMNTDCLIPIELVSDDDTSPRNRMIQRLKKYGNFCPINNGFIVFHPHWENMTNLDGLKEDSNKTVIFKGDRVITFKAPDGSTTEVRIPLDLSPLGELNLTSLDTVFRWLEMKLEHVYKKIEESSEKIDSEKMKKIYVEFTKESEHRIASALINLSLEPIDKRVNTFQGTLKESISFLNKLPELSGNKLNLDNNEMKNFAEKLTDALQTNPDCINDFNALIKSACDLSTKAQSTQSQYQKSIKESLIKFQNGIKDGSILKNLKTIQNSFEMMISHISK